MDPIRVVIAEDRTLIRAALRALISMIAGVEVAGEAADHAGAIDLVAAIGPSILLSGLPRTPPGGGPDLTEIVVANFPRTRVVLLCSGLDEDQVRRAVLAGASGYLHPHSEPEELALALSAVARGETYLSPSASKHPMADYRRQDAPIHEGPIAGLTQRQREVLRLIAGGKGTKAIARSLGISIKTVETHRSQLMERLGIHEVAGLVRHAIRIGLVTPDE